MRMESCAAFFSFKEDQKMKAELGCFIRVHYTGKLKDATVFATTEMNEPLEFTLGNHEVLPQIEEAVLNMEVGETKTIHITAEEAFGPRQEELVQEIPKELLPVGLEVKAGQQLWIEQGPGEDPLIMKVVEVSEESITLDSNHPLAGEDLTFDLELISVNIAV